MTVLDKQAQAVLREYREALEDRDSELALRIYRANPDLQKAFLQVEDEFVFDFHDSEEAIQEYDYTTAENEERGGFAVPCDYCDGTGLVDSDGNPAPYASGDLLSCPRCKGEGA